MAKSITLNASPTWSGVNDDYVLRYEGHAIGRIRWAETAWEWHITIPMAVPEWASGSADNLDECRKAFAAAWGRFLNETSPGPAGARMGAGACRRGAPATNGNGQERRRIGYLKESPAASNNTRAIGLCLNAEL